MARRASRTRVNVAASPSTARAVRAASAARRRVSTPSVAAPSAPMTTGPVHHQDNPIPRGGQPPVERAMSSSSHPACWISK